LNGADPNKAGVAGGFFTFIVEALDGVDGKLARTKLQYTKIGRYESLVDYFNETSWHSALGVGLSRVVLGAAPAILAALLILADTTDNTLYTLAGRRYGRSIVRFSPSDGAFRRIAGHRNIYGLRFIVGFCLGYHFHTFGVVAFRAAIIALVHAFRLLQYGTRTQT